MPSDEFPNLSQTSRHGDSGDEGVCTWHVRFTLFPLLHFLGRPSCSFLPTLSTFTLNVIRWSASFRNLTFSLQWASPLAGHFPTYHWLTSYQKSFVFLSSHVPFKMATARLKDIRPSDGWWLSISGCTILWGNTFSLTTSNQQALPKRERWFYWWEVRIAPFSMRRRWCRADDQDGQTTARSTASYIWLSSMRPLPLFIPTPFAYIYLLSIPHSTISPACGTLEKHVINWRNFQGSYYGWPGKESNSPDLIVSATSKAFNAYWRS